MKVGLDSSVLLRLLTGEPPDQARRAEAFLDALIARGDQPVISDLVVAEVYFALQYHYKIPKAEALAALAEIFQDGEIQATGAAPAVLKLKNLASANPGFVDRLIHSGYAAQNARMATFEKSASKLASVQIL